MNKKGSPAFEQLFAAVVVDSDLEARVLDSVTRPSVLDEYALTQDERRILLGVRANSLSEFAEKTRKALGLDED